MERKLFKNVLSIIVYTFINKVHNLRIWSLKTHVMNFEFGGHIVWNVEPKKKNWKRPSKKKTSKLTQKQPTKDQSLDKQGIDSDLRAVKTEGYVEDHADRLLSDGYKDKQLHWGSFQAKYKFHHTTDRLRSKGCEDIRQPQELC